MSNNCELWSFSGISTNHLITKQETFEEKPQKHDFSWHIKVFILIYVSNTMRFENHK